MPRTANFAPCVPKGGPAVGRGAHRDSRWHRNGRQERERREERRWNNGRDLETVLLADMQRGLYMSLIMGIGTILTTAFDAFLS